MSDRTQLEFTWIEKDNRPKLEPYAFRHPGRHRLAAGADHCRYRGKTAAEGIGEKVVVDSLELGMIVK